MDINELAQESFQIADEKGWHEKPRSPLEMHALIVSEVGEATDAVRSGKRAPYLNGDKPDGEAIELADAVIRIMDYFVIEGWDLEAAIKQKMEYNRSRPHRHGGKLY